VTSPAMIGWIDTDIIVRALFPGDPHHPRCVALLQAMERDAAEGWIEPTVVHEMTYVLGRLPTFSTRAAVHAYVRSILLLPGLRADDKTDLIEAVDHWAAGSAGFVDAWLATLASRRNLPVCSINARDFPDTPNSFF
jgi:predicted nucleic acid-binding protein